MFKAPQTGRNYQYIHPAREDRPGPMHFPFTIKAPRTKRAYASSLPYEGGFGVLPGLRNGFRSLSRGFCIHLGRGPTPTTWPETSSGDPPYGKWGSSRAGGYFSGSGTRRGPFSTNSGQGETELIFWGVFHRFFDPRRVVCYFLLISCNKLIVSI